jgi:hypothetical protein
MTPPSIRGVLGLSGNRGWRKDGRRLPVTLPHLALPRRAPGGPMRYP